jgi:hypothetical protein
MAKEYEEIYDSQSTTTSTGGPWQPGQVVVHRSGTGRGQRALLKWVLIDNAGCSRGEALVTDFAATVEYGVAKASTTDSYLPHFRGIAAATIASNKFGFAIISGYCEQADLSETAASGELLAISGSTAGKLTPNRGSSFWTATVGLSSQLGSAPFIFAVARAAAATGIGSVQILGTWG